MTLFRKKTNLRNLILLDMGCGIKKKKKRQRWVTAKKNVLVMGAGLSVNWQQVLFFCSFQRQEMKEIIVYSYSCNCRLTMQFLDFLWLKFWKQQVVISLKNMNMLRWTHKQNYKVKILHKEKSSMLFPIKYAAKQYKIFFFMHIIHKNLCNISVELLQKHIWNW